MQCGLEIIFKFLYLVRLSCKLLTRKTDEGKNATYTDYAFCIVPSGKWLET